jgi:hypothetical protein
MKTTVLLLATMALAVPFGSRSGRLEVQGGSVAKALIRTNTRKVGVLRTEGVPT